MSTIERIRSMCALAAAVGFGGCASTESTSSRVDTEAAPERYTCAFTDTPPVIDGRLNDVAWRAATWTDAFVDIQGRDVAVPRFETRAKMCWDDEYFYVGAQMEEPHVWATYDKHDMIVFHDNDFEIFIDPDGDAAQYYEIEVNALGTIFDLFLVKRYLDGGPALHAWDMKGMRHKVHIVGTLNDPSNTDEGWSVEFALPWSTLREAAHRSAPPESGDAWRVNFSRVQWRTRIVEGRYEKLPDTPEDNWVWSPQGEINMHLPRRWGYVEFVR